MSAHVENLGRAARMLKLMGDREWEGVPLKDIIEDIYLAQRAAIEVDALSRIVETPANVIPLDTYSRRVGA